MSGDFHLFPEEVEENPPFEMGLLRLIPENCVDMCL